MGWGLAGVCPGPGLMGLTTGDPRFTLWMLSALAGMQMYKRLRFRGWFEEPKDTAPATAA